MNTMQVISVIIFAAAMILIMTERVHRMTAALAGGVMMILCGIMTVPSSVKYIDAETICILVGMMLFVSVVKKSGLFEYIAIKSAKAVKGRPWAIMAAFILITAFLSAFLDNVTTVLLIGPMTFAITKAIGLNPVPFIMTQIMASNIGGTATLIGDPPNIMIGSAAELSFMDFVFNVGPAVLIVLIATTVVFYALYGKKEKVNQKKLENLMRMDENMEIRDKTLMIKSVIMIVLMIFSFIFQDILGLESAVIALGAAVIMMIIGKQDIDSIVEGVEWTSIVFFIGLFVVVGGLQESGVIDLMAGFIIDATHGKMLMAIIVILWVSALLSAFLDNIPFVATMIPLIMSMESAGIDVMPLWWALSLGACLGGNGTLIGASANVVLSGISAREGHPISFRQYMKVGFPVMIIGICICTVYLVLRFG
ncbi:MAG: ArsB/NhaD family transporter [Bacillota bacterium]|nr:ArsB/NhaD family transporter [Bacillota bacterium]